METLHLIGICISFGYIWFAVFLYPALHRMLRNKKVYTVSLCLSILIPVISIIWYNDQMTHNEKRTSFLSLCLLMFLLLYKYYDNIILKKYNRHLYFQVKHNSFWKDEESDEAESMDNWFQYSLIVLPFFLSWVLGWLVIDVF